MRVRGDRRQFLGAVVSGGAALLFGCGKSERAADRSATPGRTKVRLALNWFPEPEHGGFYAALLAGDFAAEGLDVEIVPGGPGIQVIPQLVRGAVEFGLASADQVLVQRGQEADVVTLFAPLQTNPRCILVHASSGITNFDQLRDVTLAIGAGQPFVRYLEKHAPLEGVRMVPYTGRLASFLSDPKSAQQGFVFSEPVFAEREGVRVNVLKLSELGFDPYASCVVTTRRLLDERPEIASAFVRACRRGWERYLDDSSAVDPELIRLNRELDAEGLRAAHESLRPLCQPADGRPLGSMTAERWNRLRDQLADLEFIDRAMSADQAWIERIDSSGDASE